MLKNVESFNLLLSSTKGREKFTKCLQSMTKMTIQIYMNTSNISKDSNQIIKKLTYFDKGLSSTRKILRFFNFLIGFSNNLFFNILAGFIDFYKKNEKLLDDYIEVLSKICFSCYFLLDNISWFAKINVLSDKTTPDGILSRLFNNNLIENYGDYR